MKKHLLVKINCKEKTCNECGGKWGRSVSIADGTFPWCRIFDQDLYAEENVGVVRCQECINHENYLAQLSEAWAAASGPQGNINAKYEIELFFNLLAGSAS